MKVFKRLAVRPREGFPSAMSRLFMVGLLLFSAVGVRAEILLRGIATADGIAKFSLYSSEDQTSKWVALGQSFAGCRVDTFDATYGTLTLSDGQRRFALRIENTAIPNLPPSMVFDAKLEEDFRRPKIRYTLTEGRYTVTFETGMDVAYELARKGDERIGNLLMEYESLLTAYNGLGSDEPVAVAQRATLAQIATSLRSTIGRAVAERTSSPKEGKRL